MTRTRSRAVAALIAAAGLSQAAAAQSLEQQTDGAEKVSPERRSSLFQRGYFTRIVPAMPEGLPDGPGTDDPATFPDDIRTINGRFNNLTRPWWGSAGIPFTRMAAPAYGDASGRIPARIDGPSPRAVSQAVLDLGDELIPSRFGDSNMFWLWGQFLDHDMDETPIAMPMEPFDIGVPVGDPWFDPGSSGTRQISLDRSGYQLVDGRREQVNRITAFIDASLIYGSDPARAAALRASDGTGELATSDGDLMPYNVDGFPNANDADDPTLFLAGDVRSNESVTLIAIHTLFVREHNHWAREIRAANPDFTGDEVYEHARAIMSGIMQAITYNEFLPLLLGPDAIPEYTGYDATVDPGISNVFATASFRLGHSMLPPFLERLDSNGLEASEGHLSLRQAFFTPEEIGDHGIDSALRGACLTVAENLDHLMIDDVRNFLFGMPGMGGFDLASLNIQRGRDHGLPDYNTVRQAFGLAAVDDFDDISPDPAVQAKLASVYATCDDVDPWVGMLAEPAVDGGMVGETLQATLVDQFVRVRDGDRFWYEAYLPADMIDLVNAQTLSTIIRRNTSIGDEIGDNAFIAPERCAADLDGDTELTIFDFLAFQTLFDAGDLRADFDGDGALTVFDFLEFQNAFDAGCD